MVARYGVFKLASVLDTERPLSSLTLLFGVLTAWCFYLSLERDSTLLTIGALLSCFCLILSHILSVVIVPALAVYTLICLSENPTKTVAESAYFLYSFRDAGVRTDTSTSSGLSLLRVGTQCMAAEPTLYCANACPRGECSDSSCCLLRFPCDGIQQVCPVFTLLRGCAVGTLPRSIAVSKRRWLLLILDDSCLFYFCWHCVRKVWGTVKSQSGGKILGMLMPCVLVVTLLSQVYLYFQIENGGRPRWREAFEAIRPRRGQRIKWSFQNLRWVGITSQNCPQSTLAGC